MLSIRSLQLICLDEIAEHFKRFHFAFTSSKDPILKRNLEFLQRRFSDHLSRKLLTNSVNTDLYFDFLINEHLTFLDFDCFIHSKHLKSIDDIFRHTPKLKKIEFDDHGDEIMENITKFCPKIDEILANMSQVTDKGIKYLCEVKNGKLPCPELKKIFLSGTSVTDRAVENLLRHFPLLETLEYDNLHFLLYSIHKNNLHQFQKVESYNLRALNLKRCKIMPYYTDVLKTCLSVCPKLETFACYITKKEQLDAFKSTHLKELDLDFWKITLNIDQVLKVSGCNLTHLRVKNCTISASVLAEHCPLLEQLSMFRVTFTEEYEEELIFPCLTRCDLYGTTTVSNALCLLYTSSPALESLAISSRVLTFEIKIQILMRSRFSTVKKILLMGLFVETSFLRDFLLYSRSLRCMYLSNCTYDVHDPRELLNAVAESLPNNPKIIYD